MNKPIILIIILLAGLFVMQLFLKHSPHEQVDKVSSSVHSSTENEQAEKNQETRTLKNQGSSRQGAKKINFPEDTGETVEEYNSKLVQESGFVETWDVTPEQAEESNVSQARMDYVRKRELAVQRRDYLIERRNENIRVLEEENAIINQ